MAFYKKCPHCGANLDPGEFCNCRQEQEEKERILSVMFRQETDGQMELGGLYVNNGKRSNCTTR